MEPDIEISNINTISNPPQDDDESKPKQILTRKKKSGPINVVRVALLMMRGSSPKKSSVTPKKSNVTDNESKNVWSKFVGSIRPLHLQGSRSPQSFSGRKFDQLITLPLSPSSSESTGGASVFTAEEEPFSPLQKSPSNSRYASAVGLNDLVQSVANSPYASAIGLNELVSSDEENERQEEIEEEEEEEVAVRGNGDETIDAKAEEFIAQFYQQMRLQRLNNVDRHYQERSERSLGF
ncbi:hypothetical protein P8452_62908 [Trifolium repens]|nr:hypothetical protein P8452_62908 [Trifolium repens]